MVDHRDDGRVDRHKGHRPARARAARLRRTKVINEIEPLVGYRVVDHRRGNAGAVRPGLRRLTVPLGGVDQILVPISLFTILTGAFLLVARRKAITQVLGFLVLENGVYLFGVTFAVSEPWLVQMGVLLDLMAAVFVMGIIIYHINREFDHIDIDRLSNLRDGR